ncbi:ABC transporter substrate-binding protein [Cupriavidus sp. YAF13]|uniref:ABC transporter substrate-binding protein n=1 Tax=Cupriavidus sp. YAF13 TaxID=3233075 RepID=UPI003F9291C3
MHQEPEQPLADHRPASADNPRSTTALSRRGWLQAAGTLAVASGIAPFVWTSRASAAGQLKPIKLAWNASGVCLAPVAAAVKEGIFRNHGLEVELINFGGSTDQLLEAIATKKADAGVGMALRWLKPLEQGFDVKLTAATHGGCMRLLTLRNSGVTDLKSLKGKTVAVSDMASPAKNFFSILLAKRGIDPVRDVQWRQYPADLLGIALEKGEAQAAADGDPRTYLLRKERSLVEVATNLSDEYANRSCCVLGIRGSLLREDKPAAAALTHAVLQAQDWTVAHPEETARHFAEFAKVPQADVVAMLKSHTHGHHPVGADLKKELAQYTDELKLVSVIRPGTDSNKFAERIYANVLG